MLDRSSAFQNAKALRGLEDFLKVMIDSGRALIFRRGMLAIFPRLQACPMFRKAG